MCFDVSFPTDFHYKIESIAGEMHINSTASFSQLKGQDNFFKAQMKNDLYVCLI